MDKRYVEYPLADFCKEVARPAILSPSGGAVIGVVGAMLASLAELVARVSEHHSVPGMSEEWRGMADEFREWTERLLRFADQDVQDAASIIREEEDPVCIRKRVAAPAKIASGLVKVLRLVERIAEQADASVRSDVRAIAHLGRGAADAIFEIEQSDIVRGGGDAMLLVRIGEWREEAHRAANRILEKARDDQWQN